MTLTSSEVRVAGTGELSLGPVGTALPADPSVALNAAFDGYGYTTEDGVTLSRSVSRDPIPAWQSVSPVRYVITGQELKIQLTMLQSNKETLKLWLNSGDFAAIGATTNYKADVPVSPTGQQFAGVLHWEDGAIKTRLLVSKLEVTEVGDIGIARKAQQLPVTLTSIAPDSGNVLATLMTSDPAFAP